MVANLPVQSSAAQDGSRAASAPPNGLSGSEWSGIRGACERERHAITANADGTYQAANPSQAWVTRFDGRGFCVTPAAGGWSWGLELTGYGRQTLVSTGAAAATKRSVRPADGMLTCVRDTSLSEWFVNDARGLEQGWTLGQRPPGTDATPLRLELAVRGSLHPMVSQDGGGVAFLDATGTAAVTYGALRAWDTNGHNVPLRFAAGEEGDMTIRVVVDDAAAVYPITIDPLASQAYLKASNTDADDNFGYSVAVAGDTVVIGAPGESSSATGVNGNQLDNSAFHAGAVYVFVRNGSSWSQQAYFKASNTGGGNGDYNSGDRFGHSVAVSGDTVVVGAPGESSSSTGVNGNPSSNAAASSGAAYVFVRNGTNWSQQAYLKASNTGGGTSYWDGDQFGNSVAVSGDTVVVGAYQEDSNATGVNGNQSDNSATSSGAAYVFVRGGTTWSQQAYLKASDTGAYGQFGYFVAVSADTVVVGANTGTAYVFVRGGTSWSQQAYLLASSPGYPGNSVAVDGDTVVVGAPGSLVLTNGVYQQQAGGAYVFVRAGTTWSRQTILRAADSQVNYGFGASVGVSGDMLMVGSGYSNIYSASVFTRSGTRWSGQKYFNGSYGFGSAVAVSGDLAVVGSPYEASNAVGVNGNPNDNSAWGAGTASVFVNGPQPLNDDFASRMNLGSGATAAAAGTLAGASGESLAQEPDLMDTKVPAPALGGFNNDATVWYQWTAPSSCQWAAVEVAGPQAPTVISVYTGTNLASLTKVALNWRDFPQAPNRFTFPVTGGTTYQIRVACWWKDYFDGRTLAYNLNLLAFGTPTTAAQFIARGRIWLGQGNDTVLSQAAADFSSALALDPSNGEAHFLRAITNLLLLENEPAFSQALGTLGASRTASLRSGGQLTLPQDAAGAPIFPSGARSTTIINWVTGQLLPRLATVRSDLAAVTSINFRADLTAAETGKTDALVDKGDILFLQGATHGLEMLFNLLFTYNLDVSFSAMVTLDKSGQLDAQHVLATSSSLLKFASSDRRPQFAAALRSMQQDYAAASSFALNDRANATHSVTSGMPNDAESSNTMALAVVSLNGETTYQGTRVNLSRLVASKQALRDWAPEMRGQGVVPQTLPDPTFDGVLPGMSSNQLNNRLYKLGHMWGMAQYAAQYGSFLQRVTGKDEPFSDADGDGRDNFSEWLAHTDPLKADTVWQDFTHNVITPGKNEVRLRFARRMDLSDWALHVAVSDDMVTWDRTETQIEIVGTPVSNNDGFTETVTYRLKDAAALAKRKFMRVEAAAK